MRTRFLNIDFFTPSTLKNEEFSSPFFRLPLPCLSSPPENASEDFTSHLTSVCSASHDTESLPIGSALSRFLSDVIPENVDSEAEFRDILESKNADDSFDVQIRLDSSKQVARVLEKGGEFTFEINNSTILHFEMPEVSGSLKNLCLSSINEMEHLFGDYTNKDDPAESVQVMPYPCELHEQVYSVNDIAHNLHIEQLLEERDKTAESCNPNRSFPVLEVDEMGLGVPSFLVLEDALLSQYKSRDDTQDSLVSYDSDFLGHPNFNILQHVFDCCIQKQNLDIDEEVDHLFIQPDVGWVEMLCIQEFIKNPERPINGHPASHPPPIFEEIQYQAVDMSQTFGDFMEPKRSGQDEACMQMFQEEYNQKFDRMIVIHELALSEDAFKPLPIPTLSDHMWNPLDAISKGVLENLKPQSLSTSDEIYIDWCLWDEEKPNCISIFQNIFCEIDNCTSEFTMSAADDQNAVIDFVVSDDTLTEARSEEKLSLVILDKGYASEASFQGISSNKFLHNRCQKSGDQEKLAHTDAQKVTLLSDSISQFNDLDFFMKSRKGTQTSDCMDKVPDPAKPEVTYEGLNALSQPSEVQLQQWVFKFYTVKPSSSIMILLDTLHRRYLNLANNEPESMNLAHSLLSTEKHKLLAFTKQELLVCIHKAASEYTCLAERDKAITPFVIMYAIKQTAWWLCYYGVSMAHTYIHKLCQSLDYQKLGLSFLCHLTEDLYKNACMDIAISHPSLPVIRDILSLNISPSNLKTLIVTDKFFLCPLKNLLVSMGIPYSELLDIHKDVAKQSSVMNIPAGAPQNLCCLLAFNEHTCAPVPLNEFGMIMEYGASFGFPRIFAMLQSSTKWPQVHFVKMELEAGSISDALSTGFNMLQVNGNMMGVEAENIVGQDIEELLKLISYVGKGKTNVSETHRIPPVNACIIQQNHPEARFSSFCDTVIVVNTQSSNKEMIVSRRSSYSKILATEKEGSKVLERDSSLPVDVILSGAICLVWYDCLSMGSKEGSVTESCSLSAYIENIAMNVLTLLSFSFSSCFLVFEAENSSLSIVMESSDGLYAAAASLGINIQLFFSHSPTATDEIVLNCIKYAANSNRGLYTTMPESETLAEHFLTRFPSINPLSAYAIVSSVEKLTEFFQWSRDRRINAIRKFSVSDESIALFGTLSRYGEREDSRSGMTDCSSSVSSAPDSEKSHHKRKHPVPLDEFNPCKRPNFSLDCSFFQTIDFDCPEISQRKVSRELMGEVIDFTGGERGGGFFPFVEGDQVPEMEGKPFAKAIRLGQSKKGSPWTMEFLNRVREKSKLRKQTFPLAAWNSDSNRKSPSIIDSFRLKSTSRGGKQWPPPKRPKRSAPPSSSLKKQSSTPSLRPTWTPDDKRAKQSLSFSNNGCGSQTKLIWGNRRF